MYNEGTICVLDYNKGVVDLIKFSKENLNDNESFEDYLVSLGYNLDEICYMVSPSIQSYINIHGYSNNKELMVYNKIF